MNIGRVLPSIAPTRTDNSADSPKPDPKIAKAASEFEALFVAQMLRSAREAGKLSDDDPSSGAMMEMAEDQLAQAISSGGGLGLARAIAASLNPTPTPLPDPSGLKIGSAPAPARSD